MTATLHANTIEKANGDPVDLTGQSASKAWSNLNGTGTIAERDSFNISGYVDSATGNYQATYANALSDANYSAGTYSGHGSGSGNYYYLNMFNSPSASYLPLHNVTQAGSITDAEYVLASVFGDLA